jgi:hypothetical protein
MPLGTGCFESTENGFGPYGQVSGFMSIDDVIAKLGFGRLEVFGERELDVAIARREPDIELRLRNIEASPLESDMDDLDAVASLGLDRVSYDGHGMPPSHPLMRSKKSGSHKFQKLSSSENSEAEEVGFEPTIGAEAPT